MAYVLVVNAQAGSADRDGVDAAAEVLRSSGEPAMVVATGSLDEVDAVVTRVEDGDVLVACGGDGSIHALVAAVRRAGRLDELPFAVLPMGTGNDLARHFDLPLGDPVAIAEGLVRATPRRLDLLVCEDDLCLNASHAGIGVEAAQRASGLKAALGRVAYPLGAVAAGASSPGWDLEVLVDDAPLSLPPSAADDDGPSGDGEAGGVLFVAVLNASGFGGGTKAAPDADPGDGLLDVVVATAVGPTARAGFGTALARGTHLERDDVVHARGRTVRVRGDATGWNVDGELDEDEVTDRTFTVEHAAWSLLLPPA